VSIWRTISCEKCGKSSFEVQDNGINYRIRLICCACGHEQFITQDSAEKEGLLRALKKCEADKRCLKKF